MTTKTKTFLFLLLTTLFAGAAVAGADPNAFDPIWTEISSWAVNAPGKIVAFLTFGVAVFNVLKTNYYAAIGSFFLCMLMANAQAVIEFFLGGGVVL